MQPHDLINGSYKHPLVLFQEINPRYSCHVGIPHHIRTHVTHVDNNMKYIPPKNHEDFDRKHCRAKLQGG